VFPCLAHRTRRVFARARSEDQERRRNTAMVTWNRFLRQAGNDLLYREGLGIGVASIRVRWCGDGDGANLGKRSSRFGS